MIVNEDKKLQNENLKNLFSLRFVP